MPGSIEPIAEILVPMDFSPCASRALDFAKRIAVSSDARLHLLFVDDDPVLVSSTTSQEYRDEHAARMATRFAEVISPVESRRFRVVKAIRCGTAYYEIEQYVGENHIDLIVMGNIGRSAITDALLGSVSAHVIRHATCPVLSVRRG